MSALCESLPRHVTSALVAAVLALAGCYGSLLREAPDGGVFGCPEGSLRCGGVCIDVRVDDDNCGVCSRACQAGQACGGGTCYSKDCADLACGAAQLCTAAGCLERRCVGVECPPGEACARGECFPTSCGAMACTGGLLCVDGGCRDLPCENITCPAGVACQQGRCTSACTANLPCAANPGAPCLLGRTSCGGSLSTCVNAGPAPQGIACGGGKSCNGAGACLP